MAGIETAPKHRTRSWLPTLCVLIATGALVGCGSTGNNTADATTSGASTSTTAATTVAPTTAATTTTTERPTTTAGTTTTTTTEPATSEPETSAPTIDASSGGDHYDLYSVLNFATSIGWDGIGLPEPDPECFDEAVERAPSAVRRAERELVDHPPSWFQVEPDVKSAVADAYAGCVELDTVRFLMAIGITNSMGSARCTAEAWTEEIDASTLSSSIALGLDDLPPGVVDAMTRDALGCMEEDERWWIDDIAIELEGTDGYSGEQAACLGERYVAAFGIEHALRRRVLALPILTLSDPELAWLNPAACGAEVTLPPLIVGSAVGDCLAHVLDPELPIEVVPCDSPHNGEVVQALDLSERFDEWPGMLTIESAAADACIAKLEELAVDHPEIGAAWGYPSRDVWERGGRLATCIIGNLDGTDWSGLSGLVP